MVDETTAFLVIAAMAAITVLTRVGGLWLMASVTLTPRVERALDALVGSVLIALIAPAVVEGDAGAKLAVVVAVAITWLTGRALLALFAGAAAAAALRALVG
jgi:uncharacterized membrane protein